MLNFIKDNLPYIDTSSDKKNLEEELAEAIDSNDINLLKELTKQDAAIDIIKNSSTILFKALEKLCKFIKGAASTNDLCQDCNNFFIETLDRYRREQAITNFKSNNFKIIDLLLDKGANIFLLDSKGRNIFHMIAKEMDNSTANKLLELLVNHIIRTKEINLHKAIKYFHRAFDTLKYPKYFNKYIKDRLIDENTMSDELKESYPPYFIINLLTKPYKKIINIYKKQVNTVIDPILCSKEKSNLPHLNGIITSYLDYPHFFLKDEKTSADKETKETQYPYSKSNIFM